MTFVVSFLVIAMIFVFRRLSALAERIEKIDHRVWRVESTVEELKFRTANMNEGKQHENNYGGRQNDRSNGVRKRSDSDDRVGRDLHDV